MIMSATISIYKPIDVELVPVFDRELAEYNKKSYGIWFDYSKLDNLDRDVEESAEAITCKECGATIALDECGGTCPSCGVQISYNK
jgi:rubrerythrin